jgi:acyl carrier protein
MDHNEIKKQIIQIIKERLVDTTSGSFTVDDEIDLIGSGILSSIGFIEVITELEKKFKIEFDFDNIDPSEYSSVSGIAATIDKMGKQNG